MKDREIDYIIFNKVFKQDFTEDSDLEIPFYSKSIASALKIIDFLKRCYKAKISITCYPNNECYCTIKSESRIVESIYANSLPKAICLATLIYEGILEDIEVKRDSVFGIGVFEEE